MVGLPVRDVGLPRPLPVISECKPAAETTWSPASRSSTSPTLSNSNIVDFGPLAKRFRGLTYKDEAEDVDSNRPFALLRSHKDNACKSPEPAFASPFAPYAFKENACKSPESPWDGRSPFSFSSSPYVGGRSTSISPIEKENSVRTFISFRDRQELSPSDHSSYVAVNGVVALTGGARRLCNDFPMDRSTWPRYKRPKSPVKQNLVRVFLPYGQCIDVPATTTKDNQISDPSGPAQAQIPEIVQQRCERSSDRNIREPITEALAPEMADQEKISAQENSGSGDSTAQEMAVDPTASNETSLALASPFLPSGLISAQSTATCPSRGSCGADLAASNEPSESSPGTSSSSTALHRVMPPNAINQKSCSDPQLPAVDVPNPVPETYSASTSVPVPSLNGGSEKQAPFHLRPFEIPEGFDSANAPLFAYLSPRTAAPQTCSLPRNPGSARCRSVCYHRPMCRPRSRSKQSDKDIQERLKQRQKREEEAAYQEVLRLEREGAPPDDIKNIQKTRLREATVEPRFPMAAKVTFRVVCATHWGEVVHVTGTVAALGKWDPLLGVHMKWTPGHVWECTVEVCFEEGNSIEYKYVVVKDHQISWESGSNRVLRAPAADASIDLMCSDAWPR